MRTRVPTDAPAVADPPAPAWRPVRQVTLRLPDDVGRALRDRSLREERPAKVEAARLLRSALEATGELGER